VIRATPDHKALLDHQVSQELLVIKVIVVLLGLQVFQVQAETKVILVFQDP
jgi:hypothetical protein